MTDDGPVSEAPGGRSPEEIDNTLRDAVRDIGIPPRPAILDSIAAEMRRPEPDFHRLSRLICADVGLAAGLLKTANSPFFGFRIRARTVMQALMMLGLDISSHAVAGLILRRLFVGTPAMDRFWDASARIARASGWLVGQIGVADGVKVEDAYTFGLFRDCGIAILIRRFPAYEEILREANGNAVRPFTDVEKDHLPTNHAIVGCLLAQSWWLPEETCLAVRNHHDCAALEAGSGLPPASPRLIAIGQLAEFLVQRDTGLSLTREWDKLAPACQRLLNLDDNDIERLVAESGDVVAEAL